MLLENHLVLLSHYPLLLVFIGAFLGTETIVLFATIICHNNGISLNLVIILTTCGAILGNQTWFCIGKNHGKRLLNNHERLKREVSKFKNWIKNKSALMALSSRFVYGAGSITPLLLGTNHYPQSKYFLFNAIGSIIWGTAVVKIGFLFGKQSYSYFENPKYLEYVILLIIFLTLVHWLHKHKSIPHGIKRE